MKLKNAIKRVFPYAPIDVIMDCIQRFNIKNPIEFVAQMAHECGNFKVYVENLNYSASGLAKVWPSRFANPDNTPNDLALTIARKPREIANTVYNGRMGNRIDTDDGWMYRGRGAIQMTGRDNYRKASEMLYSVGLGETKDYYLNHPEELGKVPMAIYSAGVFWKQKNLSNVTDFKTLTKRINGGLVGYEDRLKKKEALENALNIRP